ncbi:ribokinase [Trichococcus patagoniensis]|uniref:Ribokinase n=1 Tax=Trichococcus patagoniensis TaxID=382641 RepID=A0A2T5INJ7_9LACT|nr:ribokinase [Trichococcus patagoniensis]PTQ85411.1 ribokinase [Trichococcus patagoniensis]
MSNIMVLGSISTDFVVTADRRPETGETITGKDFRTTFGGKGANQAVASARLGGRVSMVGTVGEDLFGTELIENLRINGIDTSNVERVTHLPSGSAHITIVDGDNAIIYIPGANNAFDSARLQHLETELEKVELMVIQNEVPQEIVEAVIGLCFEKGVKVLYNPAPARTMDEALLEKVTFMTPNESEYKIMFPELSLSEGIKKYPGKLIVTLGSKGVCYHDGAVERNVPAYVVGPVDTTGAGDTFNGAFAVGIASGLDIEASLQLGNLAAALSVQKFGAQGGMPTLAELKENEHYEKTWNLE